MVRLLIEVAALPSGAPSRRLTGSAQGLRVNTDFRTVFDVALTTTPSAPTGDGPAAPRLRRVAVNLLVSKESLDAFDRLASDAGLSRPKMFDRLMAVEAQRLRLEADMEQMDRRDPDDTDPDLSVWVETNRVDSGR